MLLQLLIQTKEIWTLPGEAEEYLLPGEETIPGSICLKFLFSSGAFLANKSACTADSVGICIRFEVGVVQSAWASHANY